MIDNLKRSDTFWQDRNVLVTGATGLLGSWMVPALLQRGARVTVLIRDHNPWSKLNDSSILSAITVVNGALDDRETLIRCLAEYSIQTVFHLAAQTLVGVAHKDPVGTLEANVRGTWNVLEAARITNGCDVIVASSDKAYGSSETLPYTEDHPLCGQYPYDVSKSCTDLISKMYATTYGLPVAITRCGNLFGGGDLNFSRVVPGCILASLQSEQFVIRSDGQFVRDYLYVEDAVDAYLLLAASLNENSKLYGSAFNFSVDEKLTVIGLVQKILALMGRNDLEPIIQNEASNEIREQYLDSAQAREQLAWRPTFGLDSGLKKTIDWYSNYHGKTMHRSEVA